MERKIYSTVFALMLFFSLTITTSLKAQKAPKSEKGTSFVVSDGSQFVPKSKYPEFSWDITPVYYHFGDMNRVLKPEEEEFISKRTTFITIEKSHAFHELGATELGARHEVKAFKKLNADTKLLFYFNSAYACPFSSFNKNFTTEKINKHPRLKKFLLVNKETGELYSRSNYIWMTYFFDVLNPDFRKWWVRKVVKGVKISGADGVFVDQMHGFYYLRKDKKAQVEKAQGELIAALRKKLGSDKMILGNNAADVKEVFPIVDAFMFEHYSKAVTTKENLLKEWGDMLRVAKAGKISVFRFGCSTEGTRLAKADKALKEAEMPKLAQEQITYYLACYLIGAQPYSYFQYGWGWDLEDGNLVDYPELEKPLGAPKGAYKRLCSDKWEFTREFEHASVWLDTENKTAKIDWK